MPSREALFPLDAGPTRALVRVVLVGGLAVAAWLLALALSSPALASTDTGDTGQQEPDTTTAPAEPPADEHPTDDTSEPTPPADSTEPAEPSSPEQPGPVEDTEPAEQPADSQPTDPAEPEQPAKDTAGSPEPKDPDQPEPESDAPAETNAGTPGDEQVEHRDHTDPVLTTTTAAMTTTASTVSTAMTTASTAISTVALPQDSAVPGLVNSTVNGLLDTVRGTVDRMLHDTRVLLPPINRDRDCRIPALPDLGGLLPDFGNGHWPFPSQPLPGDDWPGSLPPPGETGGPGEPAVPPIPVTGPVPEQSVRTGPEPPDRRSVARQSPGPAVATDVPESTRTAATPETPDAAETRASGGGSGSGPLAPAPTGPVGSTGQVHASTDSSAGGRQPLAVLGSAANTTQLRLIGTSRDAAAEGAGRDAALPTTSPD